MKCHNPFSVQAMETHHSKSVQCLAKIIYCKYLNVFLIQHSEIMSCTLFFFFEPFLMSVKEVPCVMSFFVNEWMHVFLSMYVSDIYSLMKNAKLLDH